MSVIVDTSVWSHVLRRGTPSSDPSVVKLMDVLNRGRGSDILLLGVILQEILQGIRNETDFARVRQHLEVFPLVVLDRQDYIAAAELRNHCQSCGINAGTIDFQIAAACIERDCSLLTSDKDFSHIASCCSLRLV